LLSLVGEEAAIMHIGKCLRHAAASTLSIALALMLGIGLVPADALAEGVGGVAL